MRTPPITFTFGWDAWERLKAVYVPQEGVDQLAADCIVEFGPGAIRFVETEIDRAKRRGETGEYWLAIRVKETIERMEASGSLTQQ
ncbi:MAG TPA: hypothetical protein VII56_01520 [Rhizomicrobium sp.]